MSRGSVIRLFVAVGALALAACEQPTAPRLAVELAQSAEFTGVAPVVIEVKFSEALRVRTAGGELRDASGQSLDTLVQILVAHGNLRLQPLFTLPAERIDALTQAATTRSGRTPPDLGSWYYTVAAERADADRLVVELNGLPQVDTAYTAPAPAPPPGELIPLTAALAALTPDFTARQTYFGPAPFGIDADFARTQPGGSGNGIKIVDLEYDWFFQHEDLELDDSILLGGDRFTLFGDDHGTAVLGILFARQNGFGITGGVPASEVRVASPIFATRYVPALAIIMSVAEMAPGDVLLLEQQAAGPNGNFVPLEWIPSVYDAILFATNHGAVVVEAAGNGSQNLDADVFQGRFDRERFNSGAIIVGAGDLHRARLGFSTYGSRVDVQGRGVGVTSTGYGGLFGTSHATRYTGSFSGTSSASAIVAVAVAAIQGYARANTGVVLVPAELSVLLRTSGTPQGGVPAQPIGPLPDLRAALGALTPLAASASSARAFAN